jgi:Tfp pilus assembly protein PilF/4-amino-4-deoxy-L-arabinose transferase-like glycosyltransferase
MSFVARNSRRIDAAALCIFIVALGARILHTLAVRESPFFENLLVDSVDFDARAAAFLDGRWPEPGAFFQAPLYPLFLSLVYRIFGHDLLAARVVQAVLGSLSAVLVYYVGRRCAGRAAGIVAGAMYSVYAMAIHFDSEILRPSLVVFLSLCSLLLLMRAAKARAYATLGAAGLILGLACTARPTLLLFLPLALVWVLFRAGAPWRPRSPALRPVLSAALFAACALVPVTSVTVTNYARSGSFVPISYNGGINFYIGNNAEYDQTVGIRPGIRWDLLTAEPEENRITDPSGWSGHYYKKSRDYILSDPAGYGALLFKKAVLFWNGFEIERNTSFEHVADFSPVFATPLASFRWIAPLALAGMILAWRRRAALGLPALLLASQFAATVLFFVCARYRMTSVPVLCLFAGFAAVGLFRMVRGRDRAAALYGGIAVLLAIAVNVDAYGISHMRFSRPEYELAQVLRRDGKTDEAARLFESAASADPSDPDPLFQSGVLMAGRGRHAEAASFFLAAARLEPRYSKSWFNLGLSMSRSGDPAGAVDAFRRALEADPSYWEAAMGLGDALVEEGRYAEAAEAYEKSRGLATGSGQAAVSAMSLGRAVALSGDYDASLVHFDEALAQAPGSVDARLAKARVLIVLNRTEEAANEVRLAAAVDSTDTRVKAMMERLGLSDGGSGGE